MAGKKLHTMVVDLKKVFDCVPRKVIWLALKRKGVMEKEVLIVKKYLNICEN